MRDLKPYLDDVVNRKASVDKIAEDMDELMRDGSDEGKALALELKPELVAAQDALKEAEDTYERMKQADAPSDVLKNFVPVSNDEGEPGPDQQPSTIKRVDYDKLSPEDRSKFVHSGGKVED